MVLCFVSMSLCLSSVCGIRIVVKQYTFQIGVAQHLTRSTNLDPTQLPPLIFSKQR